MAFVLLAGLALGALPGRASAQAGSHDEEARALFVAGTVAYQEGRFEDAYQRYLDAYEVSRRPELQYNLAMAAERLRRDALALEHYRRYLAELPDAENRGVVERRIAFLEEQLGTGAPATTATTAEVPAAEPEAGEPEAEGEDDAEEAGTTRRGALVATYALAGATAAAGAVLLWSGLDAQDARDAYHDAIATGDLPTAEAALDDLHAAERRTNALVGATLALAAGTATAALIQLLRADQDEPPPVEASVGVGARAAGLFLRGAF